MRALFNIAYATSDTPALGLTSWGPTINLLRDTRWGRTQESVSEDPYLSGRFGVAVTRGLQEGEDARYLLAVSGLKHFAGYR
jgi:beta-glucosidase-like glycosyl hydrolase